MQTAFPDRRSRLNRTETLPRWLEWSILRWDDPLWSALLAMIVYTAIAAYHGGMLQASKYAYFNFLADAFLRGQLYLEQKPTSTHDLSLFLGRYYLYWPPFPAVLLMPFVALAGVKFSDILFTVGLGGLNVGLVVVLLQTACKRKIISLTGVQRGLLVLTFALGTVHVTLAPYGRVWYTAQLIGFATVTLAYLAAIGLDGRKAFVLAGVALGGAFLTRNHLVLAGVWPAIYLLHKYWSDRWPKLIGHVVAGLLPVMLAVALLGVYNWLRFGNALDNGLEYHRMSAFFRADYEQYGAFNLYYLPANLRYQYFFYPYPLRPESELGGSLFLLTPAFFSIFGALVWIKPRWSTWGLAASIVLVAIPILLLMGTGWRQFGPRYSLDFSTPLLLLAAIGIRRWPLWLLGGCTILAVLQYVVGAVWLGGVI